MTRQESVMIILDVDTGVDDAMALALAVALPGISLLGVSTVAGNVEIDKATANTLRVLDAVGGNDVPVFRGMNGPLTRDHFDAVHIHGSDGLGGAMLPGSHRDAEPMTAPEFIVQTARQYAGDITLVFVGPLTNLAVALKLEPELPSMVARTVVMGGAFTVPGNATPWAEFNIAVDPEAARIVSESALDVTWIGLDVTHSANLYRRDWASISEDDAPGARLVRDVCRASFEAKGYDAMHLHDPLALGVVVSPHLVEYEDADVLVDTSVRDSAGMTRIVAGRSRMKNRVATSVNSEAFRTLFGNALEIPAITSGE